MGKIFISFKILFFKIICSMKDYFFVNVYGKVSMDDKMPMINPANFILIIILLRNRVKKKMHTRKTQKLEFLLTTVCLIF